MVGGAEGNLNSGDLAQEVSEENSFSMWPRDCSYNILVKNVAAFYPCPKSLLKAKVKRFGLITLINRVSKTALQRLYSLMKSILIKHSKLRKEKYKMCGSSIKGAPGSRMELNPVFKDIK